MSHARRDPETVLATWLAEGPSAMPEALRHTIARDARASSQHRTPWGASGLPIVRSLRPAPAAGRLMLVLAVIGVLLALMIGLATLGAMKPDPLHGLRTAAPNGPAEGIYQAALVRVDDPASGDVVAIDIVAVRADGRERTIGRVSGSSLPAEARDAVAGVAVSPDGGWLAFRASGPRHHGWAFADLKAPDRPVRFVEIPWWGGYPSGAYGTWGPDGRFVGSASEYHETFQAIDLLTGEVTIVPGIDAKGIVELGRNGSAKSGGVLHVGGFPGGTVWATGGGVDGSPLVFGQTTGPRDLRSDGTVLDVCHVERGACARADVHDGTVTSADPRGALSVQVVDELLPDRVGDASYGVDGSTLWLVLRPETGAARPILARIDPDGSVSVIRDFRSPIQGVLGTEGCCPSPWPAFAGIAPDDSLVALDTPGLPGPVIMSTSAAGPPPWAHTGRFAGFLLSAAADALPGGDWVEPPNALGDARSTTGNGASSDASEGPSVGPTPASPELPAGFQLVKTEIHEGTGESGGSHVAVDLGPFDATHGLAIFMTCVGPSEARLTTDLPGDEAWANACFGNTIGGERPVPLTGGPVTVTVTADPATTWQVSIFIGVSAP